MSFGDRHHGNSQLFSEHTPRAALCTDICGRLRAVSGSMATWTRQSRCLDERCVKKRFRHVRGENLGWMYFSFVLIWWMYIPPFFFLVCGFTGGAFRVGCYSYTTGNCRFSTPPSRTVSDMSNQLCNGVLADIYKRVGTATLTPVLKKSAKIQH